MGLDSSLRWDDEREGIPSSAGMTGGDWIPASAGMTGRGRWNDGEGTQE